MKISYVTTFDASDVHNWSGTSFYLAQTLKEQKAEIEYIGNLRVQNRNVLKAKSLLYDKAFRRRFLMEREISVADNYAQQIAKRISPASHCVLSPGSIPIARLETTRPKVFYTDATFAGMLGFYDGFSNLCAESIRNGHQLEQDALSSCSLAIYSSDWAARTALQHYKVDPAKVKVVPFGANIDCDRVPEDIQRIVGLRSKQVCKLLFLGVDWDRKGGALAVNIVKALNRLGVPAQLHIAGIRDLPLSPLPEYIRNYGFISKATQKGRDKLDRLMMECHFLLLPAKAEAYGLVFCEANSFGLPAIATQVGGIPTIVKDDINGKLFPLTATAAQYAAYIGVLFGNYAAYAEMAMSSFHEFSQRLNWQVSGKKIMHLLKDL